MKGTWREYLSGPSRAIIRRRNEDIRLLKEEICRLKKKIKELEDEIYQSHQDAALYYFLSKFYGL